MISWHGSQLFWHLIWITCQNCSILSFYIMENVGGAIYHYPMWLTQLILYPAAIQAALAIAFSKDTSEATNSTSVVDMTETEVVEEAAVNNLGIQWNMYTATGWIGCFLGFINIILFLPCIFKVSLLYSIDVQENHMSSHPCSPDHRRLDVHNCIRT